MLKIEHKIFWYPPENLDARDGCAEKEESSDHWTGDDDVEDDLLTPVVLRTRLTAINRVRWRHHLESSHPQLHKSYFKNVHCIQWKMSNSLLTVRAETRQLVAMVSASKSVTRICHSPTPHKLSAASQQHRDVTRTPLATTLIDAILLLCRILNKLYIPVVPLGSSNINFIECLYSYEQKNRK